MGIFDWFKRKAKPTPPEPQQNKQPEKQPEPRPVAQPAAPITPQTEPQPTKAKEPYQGDLSKTNQIFHLLKVPQNERDENWQNLLLTSLGAASFKCGDPQIIQGPDGFPYFQLLLPAQHESFQCFVIDRMKDDFLLENGFGVAINPSAGSVDWVLTYGDILNLHLNGEFYTTGQTDFSSDVTDEVILENEDVMIAQPSEAILPAKTRKILSEFLRSNGIATPKVAFMMRHNKNGAGMSQDIVFNTSPNLFPDETAYRNVMQAIGWFLPKHYSFVGLEETVLGDGFMEL